MFFPEATEAAKTIAAELKLLRQSVDGLNKTLLTIGTKMDEALEKIRVQVEATNTTEASALVFIQGIVAELKLHAGEIDKVNALADALAAGRQPLADAIAANP